MGDECNVLSHRVEDLESSGLKELKKGEKEIPVKRHVRECPSGEPGDEEVQIPNDMKDFPEVNAAEVLSEDQEKEVCSKENVKSRPNVVAFAPECVVETEESAKAKVCFENVDLKSQDDQLFPEPKESINPQPLKKPFSFSFTPVFKKNVPKVQIMTAEDAVISIPTNEPSTREEVVENQPIQSRNFSINFFIRNRTQIAVIIASFVICTVLIVYVVL